MAQDQEREPLLVEANVPFRINPNLDRATVSDDVKDDRSYFEEGLGVDIINFEVKDSSISGDIELLSLYLDIEQHEPLQMPAGEVYPYSFDVTIYGLSDEQTENNSVGFRLAYETSRYDGSMNYDLSDEAKNIAWIENWGDLDNNDEVALVFPRSAVPEVEFTLLINPQPSSAQ
jgi:hypothetical protein